MGRPGRCLNLVENDVDSQVAHYEGDVIIFPHRHAAAKDQHIIFIVERLDLPDQRFPVIFQPCSRRFRVAGPFLGLPR